MKLIHRPLPGTMFHRRDATVHVEDEIKHMLTKCSPTVAPGLQLSLLISMQAYFASTR